MPAKIQKVALLRLFVRHFKLFVIAILIVLLAASYFLLIGPKINKIGNLSQTDLKNKQADLQGREKYLQDLKNLLANYEKLTDEEIGKINMILPSKKDIAGIFAQFEALAEQNDITLQAIDVSVAAEEDASEATREKIKEMDISLSLAGGDYNTYKSFLDDLEYNIRILDVISTSFSPDFSSYSVNLKTYYFAQ